jgi:hypothetical protein
LANEANEPYLIRETDRFEAHVFAEFANLARWEEIKETLDLYIARDPLAFESVPGTELRAVGISTNPPMAVYFSVDTVERVVTYEGIYYT